MASFLWPVRLLAARAMLGSSGSTIVARNPVAAAGMRRSGALTGE